MDLYDPKPFFFTWPAFEFESINCPIDAYKVTCLDENDDEYTVGFTSEILARKS